MRNSHGWDRDNQRNFTSVLVRLAADQNAAAAATQAGASIDRQVVLRSVTGSDIASAEKRIAWWLAGVSMVVFAIGLANAATLLIVRGARMRHELNVRAALGASRSRLMREGALEAFVLALIAVAVSLVLASWLDELVRRVLFPGVIERTASSARVMWAGMAAGIIAVGFLAVPVMTTGAAYDLCQVFGWKHGLHAKPAEAKKFYLTIAAFTFVAMGMNFFGFNPMKALVFAGVVQGFSTPPLLLLIMLMTNNRSVMGERVNSFWINLLGWTTTAAVFAASLGLVYTWFV